MGPGEGYTFRKIKKLKWTPEHSSKARFICCPTEKRSTATSYNRDKETIDDLGQRDELTKGKKKDFFVFAKSPFWIFCLRCVSARCVSLFAGRCNLPALPDSTPSSLLPCLPAQCTVPLFPSDQPPPRSPLLLSSGVQTGAYQPHVYYTAATPTFGPTENNPISRSILHIDSRSLGLTRSDWSGVVRRWLWRPIHLQRSLPVPHSERRVLIESRPLGRALAVGGG
ncbi:unnamed protein product [Ectocarpus sp. 13 AM-2016]